MRDMLLAGTCAAAVLLCAPCLASTVPVVDFEAAKVNIALGAIDASVDYGISNRWSLGLSGLSGIVTVGATRATCRVSEGPWGSVYGITLSAGINQQAAFGMRVPNGTLVPAWNAIWIQPTLIMMMPLQWNLKLRGSIGPYLGLNLSNSITLSNVPAPYDLLLLPNLELAIPIDSLGEVTLGGNSLIGWRTRL